MAKEQHSKLDYTNILRLLDATAYVDCASCRVERTGMGSMSCANNLQENRAVTVRDVQSILNAKRRRLENPSRQLATNSFLPSCDFKIRFSY